MPVFHKGVAVEGLALSPTLTVAALRAQLSAKLRLNVHRIELRTRPASASAPVAAAPAAPAAAQRLDDDSAALGHYGVGIGIGTSLDVKDLGPQFSYRGVFLVEYLGPILIVLAVALRAPVPGLGALLPATDYPRIDVLGALAAGRDAPDGSAEWNRCVQALGLVLWVLHFAKRELETVFVHKFSRATMPLFNLFKNSAYYWTFALFVALPLCNAHYSAPGRTQVALSLVGWLLAELVNLAVHVQLSCARGGEGDKKREAPGGPLFALVSCPNYTAEVLGWVFWTALTQVAVGGVFTLVGLAQMVPWALQKHRGYMLADDKYKKLGRKAIIPFVV